MQLETFVLDDPTTTQAYDELAELAAATTSLFSTPAWVSSIGADLPESFRWDEHDGLTF